MSIVVRTLTSTGSTEAAPPSASWEAREALERMASPLVFSTLRREGATDNLAFLGEAESPASAEALCKLLHGQHMKLPGVRRLLAMQRPCGGNTANAEPCFAR